MHPCRGQDGRTALMRAILLGFTDCARLLIVGGANTEIKDSVRVADKLNQCLLCQDLHISGRLRQPWAWSNYNRCSSSMQTKVSCTWIYWWKCTCWKLRSWSISFSIWLLSFFTNFHTQPLTFQFIWHRYLSHVQDTKRTALMGACGDGRTECVKLLLEAGANKEARDIVCEERPLVMTIDIFIEGANVFLQIFAWKSVCLLSLGGNVWRHLQNGTTALIYAAGKGHLECVRLLINHGANKEAADKVQYCLRSRMLCKIKIRFARLFLLVTLASRLLCWF